MTHDLPPIAKKAERLMLDIELAVRAFSQSHKYVLGVKLRKQIAKIMRFCNRAWRDQERRLKWTKKLVWQVDELKFSLQLGKQLEAFRSFNEFQTLIIAAEDLGMQAGGWKRQQEHPNGQNSPSRTMRGARRDTEYPRRPVPTGAKS